MGFGLEDRGDKRERLHMPMSPTRETAAGMRRTKALDCQHSKVP